MELGRAQQKEEEKIIQFAGRWEGVRETGEDQGA